LPQSTRVEKYRTYRERIAKLPREETRQDSDAKLLSPQKSHAVLETDDGIRRTNSIPVKEILKATNEISGLPEQDEELDEARLNRRFAMKVVLICVVVVIAIVAIVAWIINGGNN